MSNYFHALNYSLGDEDTALELAILPEASAHVVAIAGCGGRILPLLAKRPKRLVCVDILPQQLAFTRLRLALLADLDRGEFLKFLGYRSGMSTARRKKCLFALDLPQSDREILSGLFDALDWCAPIYAGRFERMLRTLYRIARLITGVAGRNIFETKGLDAQRAYYETTFPQRRWKAVLALLGNSAVLNSLLYRGDFPKNNLGISSFRRYEQIFHTLFTSIPARESFFLQMVFFGELVFDEGFPVECQEAGYGKAKQALSSCEIEVVKSDAVAEIARRREVDFVSISDVPSFMPNDSARTFLQDMRGSLAQDAIVVSRAHMRLVRPDLAGFEDVSARFAPVAARETTQLWHVNVYRHQAC